MNADRLTYFRHNAEMFALGSNLLYDIFYSSDGKTFYQMKERGFAGDSMRNIYRIGYANPHIGEAHREVVVRNGDVLECNGKTFHKVQKPSEMQIVLMPKMRTLIHLYRFANGEILYVSEDTNRPNDMTIRVFVGPIEKMLEYELIEWGEQLHGIVTGTDYGNLFVPYEDEEDKNAKWETPKGSQLLEELDPKDFVIVETDEGVHITKV